MLFLNRDLDSASVPSGRVDGRKWADTRFKQIASLHVNGVHPVEGPDLHVFLFTVVLQGPVCLA